MDTTQPVASWKSLSPPPSRGDLQVARSLLQKLDATATQSNRPEEAAFILGQLGQAYARLGLSKESTEVVPRIAALCTTGSTSNVEDVRFAVAESLGNLACIQAEALGADVMESTLGFIGNGSMSSDGARFCLARAQAKVLAFSDDTARSVKKVADNWTQARLFYLMAAALAEYGKPYDENSVALSKLGDELGQQFRGALADQLRCDRAIVAARRAEFHLALDAAKQLEHRPDLQVDILVALAVQTGNRNASKAKEVKPVIEALLDRALIAAMRVDDSFPQVRALQEIGQACVEAGKLQFGIARAENQTSSFVKAALLCGIGRKMRDREGVVHAANEGVTCAGYLGRPNTTDVAHQKCWQDYLTSIERRSPDVDRAKAYVVSAHREKTGEVLVVRTSNGLDIAFAPRASGLIGFGLHCGTSFFTNDEAAKIGRIADGPVGHQEEVGRFRVTKRVATRPPGWIVISLRERIEPAMDVTASPPGANPHTKAYHSAHT